MIDTSLMFVIPQPPGVNALVIFIQGTPGIWVSCIDGLTGQRGFPLRIRTSSLEQHSIPFATVA